MSEDLLTNDGLLPIDQQSSCDLSINTNQYSQAVYDQASNCLTEFSIVDNPTDLSVIGDNYLIKEDKLSISKNGLIIHNKSAALKIIFEVAGDINILGKISIVGNQAELVLKSSKQITCNSCLFDNIGQLTIDNQQTNVNQYLNNFIVKGGLNAFNTNLKIASNSVLFYSPIMIDGDLSINIKVASKQGVVFDLSEKSLIIANNFKLDVNFDDLQTKYMGYSSINQILIKGVIHLNQGELLINNLSYSNIQIEKQIKADKLEINSFGIVKIGNDLNIKLIIIKAGNISLNNITQAEHIKITDFYILNYCTTCLITAKHIVLKGRANEDDLYSFMSHLGTIQADELSIEAITNDPIQRFDRLTIYKAIVRDKLIVKTRSISFDHLQVSGSVYAEVDKWQVIESNSYVQQGLHLKGVKEYQVPADFNIRNSVNFINSPYYENIKLEAATKAKLISEQQAKLKQPLMLSNNFDFNQIIKFDQTRNDDIAVYYNGNGNLNFDKSLTIRRSLFIYIKGAFHFGTHYQLISKASITIEADQIYIYGIIKANEIILRSNDYIIVNGIVSAYKCLDFSSINFKTMSGVIETLGELSIHSENIHFTKGSRILANELMLGNQLLPFGWGSLINENSIIRIKNDASISLEKIENINDIKTFFHKKGQYLQHYSDRRGFVKYATTVHCFSDEIQQQGQASVIQIGGKLLTTVSSIRNVHSYFGVEGEANFEGSTKPVITNIGLLLSHHISLSTEIDYTDTAAKHRTYERAVAQVAQSLVNNNCWGVDLGGVWLGETKKVYKHIPSTIYVKGQITGQFSGIANIAKAPNSQELNYFSNSLRQANTVISLAGTPLESIVPNNRIARDNPVIESDNSMVNIISNPNMVSADLTRAVNIQEQHENIVTVVDLSHFPTHIYDLDKEFYIQYKYPPLEQCDFGTTEFFKLMGVDRSKYPKIFTDRDIEKELLSNVMIRLIGRSLLVEEAVSLFKQVIDNYAQKQAVSKAQLPKDELCQQLQFLLTIGYQVKDKYGLIIGQLPADQVIQNVKEPFAWPVKKIFNGKEVLALELILPQLIIRNSAAWYGAFLGAGSWNIEVEGKVINSGALYSQHGGKMITKQLENYGQLILDKGEFEIKTDQLIVASVVEVVNYSAHQIQGVSSTVKAQAGITAASGAKYHIHASDSALIQAAKLDGHIVIETEGSFIAVTAKLYQAVLQAGRKYSFQQLSISNLLNELSGKITFIGSTIDLEGLKLKSGTTLDFHSKFGTTISSAVDVEAYWSYSKKHKKRLALVGALKSSSTITQTISYQESLTPDQVGDIQEPLEQLNIQAQGGDITLIGFKANTNFLNLRSGTADQPSQVKLLPQELTEFHQVISKKKSWGFKFDNLIDWSVARSERQMTALLTSKLSPTVLRINDEAYIFSQGQYQQLSSHLIGDKLELSSPSGLLIAALYDREINYVEFNKQRIGTQFVANSNEIAVKAGLFFKAGAKTVTQQQAVAPIVAFNELVITGAQLNTQGVNFHYQEALFNVTKHLDQPSFNLLAVTQQASEAELIAKLGIKFNLKQAIERTEQLVDSASDQNNDAKTLNVAMSSVAAYFGWLQALAAPIEGGIWLEANYHQQTTKIDQLQVMPSLFRGNTTIHNANELDFTSTQLTGNRWFVSGKTIKLATAFNSYEQKIKANQIGIGVNVNSGQVSLNAGVNSQQQASANHYHLNIMMQQQVMIQLEGELSLEGGSIIANQIELNVGSLLIKSVIDTNKAHNWGINIGLGTNIQLAKTSLNTNSLGFNYGKANSQVINEISQIVGEARVHIVVNGLLKNVGAVIASATRNSDGSLTDEGELYIKAAELITQDIYGHDEGRTLAASFSYGGLEKDSNHLQQLSTKLGYQNYQQLTKATFGAGSIEIGDDVNNELAKVNRDLKQVQQLSGDKFDLSLYLPLYSKAEITALEDQAIANLKRPGTIIERGAQQIRDAASGGLTQLVEGVTQLNQQLAKGGQQVKDTASGAAESVVNIVNLPAKLVTHLGNQITGTLHGLAKIFSQPTEQIDKASAYTEITQDQVANDNSLTEAEIYGPIQQKVPTIIEVGGQQIRDTASKGLTQLVDGVTQLNQQLAKGGQQVKDAVSDAASEGANSFAQLTNSLGTLGAQLNEQFKISTKQATQLVSEQAKQVTEALGDAAVGINEQVQQLSQTISLLAAEVEQEAAAVGGPNSGNEAANEPETKHLTTKHTKQPEQSQVSKPLDPDAIEPLYLLESLLGGGLTMAKVGGKLVKLTLTKLIDLVKEKVANQNQQLNKEPVSDAVKQLEAAKPIGANDNKPVAPSIDDHGKAQQLAEQLAELGELAAKEIIKTAVDKLTKEDDRVGHHKQFNIELKLPETDLFTTQYESVEFKSKNEIKNYYQYNENNYIRKFFKGATGKSIDFKITQKSDGAKQLEFFSPANNPGYGKKYVQLIDNSGNIIKEFKDTIGPEGLIERKWLHGYE